MLFERVVRLIRTWPKTRLVILHLSPSVPQRLLLNYIEAQYMLDHNLNAKSISYWKAIREAAGFTGEAADPQTTIAATDMAQELKGYTDGSGTQYDWGAFSAGKALTDPTLYSIRRERRTELMAEGLRWMDFDSLAFTRSVDETALSA